MSNDEDVVESFAEIAREAFAATHASVLLYDEAGELYLAAGTNPLWGNVAPVETLRRSPVEIVVTVDDAETEYPDLAAGLRAARLDALSIMPLSTESQQLGILVCLFSRQRDFDAQFFELQRALGRQASQTLVRVRLQRQLSHMALHDQLTGLANRQLLLQSIDAAIADAEQSGDALSLVFLDIDGFKAVNDRLGHAAGDAVLREVAERLRNAVRADDILGRMGGDEFVVICPTADARAAASIAERLRSFSRHQIEAGPSPCGCRRASGSRPTARRSTAGRRLKNCSSARTRPCTSPRAAARTTCRTSSCSLRISNIVDRKRAFRCRRPGLASPH